MNRDPRQVRLYRTLTLLSGLAYLLWWGAVELLLPGSFNPLGSRLVVVAFCLAVFAASFRVDFLARNISKALAACTGAVTLHYFYLFRWNDADINWVVGAYILVIAVSACTTTMAELAAYSGFVLFLSGVLVRHDPELLRSIFLPGVVTILFFAYVGLRPRLRLVARSREEAARIQSLFDAVNEGVLLHEDGLVIDANDSFARLFGYRRDELPGMSVARFAAPESRLAVAESVRAGTPTSYEAMGLRKDGTTLPLEITGKTHLFDGRTVRLTAVRDLTERRRAEDSRIKFEAAEEALRVRDEFLLILSHELKTPITNIKLQTDLARRSLARSDGLADPQKVKRLIEQTDRHANRLVRLVEDMVDLARIGMGDWQQDRRPCDLSELARNVVAAHAEALLQAKCDVKLLAGTPVVVLGDAVRLEQVVVNLLTNAMKYGAGRPITVSTESRGDEAVLTVQDEGMGISSEDQERIFKRFERAVSARHISGMGLGLFICKFIVEGQGGRIELASEPGKGSRFSVVLQAPREAA
jgi:PAS domain S-box-containing protein